MEMTIPLAAKGREVKMAQKMIAKMTGSNVLANITMAHISVSKVWLN